MKKFLIIALKVFVFFMGWALLAGLLPVPATTNHALWRFWAELIPLLAVIFMNWIFWMVDKRKLHLCIFRHMRKGCSVGLITGIVWLFGSLGILYLLGTVSYQGSHSVDSLWIWFISAFLNAMMQELLVRGYLYQMIKKRYNLVAATVVTTALFVLLHGDMNLVSLLNVVTMSLMMTCMLEYTQSLWAPIMAHFIWNAVGHLIFGAVSLASDYPQFMILKFVGSDILSGGVRQLEGSIIVLLMNGILCGFFLAKARAR